MIEIITKTQSEFQLTGTAAESASQIGSSGSERKISIRRCTVESTHPPK